MGLMVNLRSFFPSGLPRWERMTRDLGLCERTLWMVGRVAEMNERGTLDAGRVDDFVFLDRDVEVGPHQDL